MSRIIVIALLASNLILIGLRAAQSPAPDSTASPRVTLDPWIPRLILLSEMPDAGTGAGRQCFSLGPFETRQASDAALAVLEAVVESVTVRETESLVELGYWVALPGAADVDAAGAQLDALQAAGFEDLAVVTDTDGAYRVSLGYFLDEANARRRRDSVREKGFDADTRLQRQTEQRFWLDYVQSPGATPAVETLDATVDRSLNRGIPCA